MTRTAGPPLYDRDAPRRAELVRRRGEDDTLAQVVTTLNAFNERHGFMSDEFSDFSASQA